MELERKPLEQAQARVDAFAETRKGWQESDLWVGYYGGRLRLRSEGEQHEIRPSDKQAPLVFGSSAILVSEADAKFEVRLEDDRGAYPSYLYLVGLDPARRYEVRLNKGDWATLEPPPGGVIAVRNVRAKGDVMLDLSKPVRLQIRDGGPRTSGPRPTLGP